MVPSETRRTRGMSPTTLSRSRDGLALLWTTLQQPSDKGLPTRSVSHVSALMRRKSLADPLPARCMAPPQSISIGRPLWRAHNRTGAKQTKATPTPSASQRYPVHAPCVLLACTRRPQVCTTTRTTTPRFKHPHIVCRDIVSGWRRLRISPTYQSSIWCGTTSTIRRRKFYHKAKQASVCVTENTRKKRGVARKA